LNLPFHAHLGIEKELETRAKKIIHVDMDAFYASVEQRDNPALRGRPVCVGGNPQSRGVVASCSYEARKFGIRSAMSCAKAQRLCPDAVFVYPDFDKYRRASDGIREVFLEVTDLVEPLSLDEAFLDVTQNHFNEPMAGKLARWIKDQIKLRLNLTASAGAGPNKFLAKLASDLKKPDGLCIIPPEKALDFIATLPVEKLWSVGPATAKKLQALGIWTAGDLRKWDIQAVDRALGKHGIFLHQLSHGIDDREVDPSQETKSLGSETTFEKDITNLDELARYLEEISLELADQLQELGRPGRTVTLKLRYKDFKTITRSKTLDKFTDQATVISKVATKLLRENTEAGQIPARLIGISISSLRNDNDPEQLWFDFPEVVW
jgi:DNA polymerase-4